MNRKMVKGLFVTKVLIVAVVLSSHGLCGEVYKKSSLIVPQGISYRFTPISFTRDVKVVDGRFETKSIKAKDTSGTAKLDSEDHSASDSATTKDTTIEKNSGVKANAGASAKAGVSLLTGVHASAEVHGGVDVHGRIERNLKQTDYSARSSANKTDMFSTRANSFRDADSVEDSMRGKYGDWYLTFAMYIKNLDISDVCYACPTNGIPLSAVVEGLSQPIIVPCERQHTIRIGIEDVVCRFTAPVHDQKLLRELMALEEAHGMDKLSIQIDGANFPVISQSTGKNILQEMKLVEMKNPTTEIRLGFGDAKVLSPWRVKQRLGRSSGRRGQLATLRDALDAINDKIAEDDSMPERVFEYDSESNLCAVSEIRLGTPDMKGDIVPCVKFDDDLTGATVQVLDKKMMDTPIKQFKSIEFFDLDIQDLLDKYKEDPPKYNTLYHRIINNLKRGDMNNKKVCMALGFCLCSSDTEAERVEGYRTLYAYWDKSKDTDVIVGLFNRYLWLPLNDKKKFPYRNKISEWIPEFAKNERWISETKSSTNWILERVIEDEQTDSVVELSKIPSFAYSTNGVTALMIVARAGNVPMAKALLKEVKFDVNGGNWEWGTALEWAAKNDKVEMCKFLVGIGADPNKTFGDEEKYRTAVDVAARNNALEALKYLIEQAGGELRHAHFCAAEGGAFEAIQYLMEKAPIGMNEVWDGPPLLSYAAWGGNLQLCRYLVEKGAFVEYSKEEVEYSYDFPICVAARQKHLEVMNFLLEQGAKFTFDEARVSLLNNWENWLEEKITAHKIDAGNVLLAAICQNKVDAVKKFIRFVDNINTGIGDYKWLPLATAAHFNSVDAARELIKAGAKVSFSLEGKNTPLEGKNTPLQQACREGSLDMVKYLIEECAVPIGDCPIRALDKSVIRSVAKKQKEVLKYLIQLKIDGVNAVDIDKSYGSCTLLSKAALEGDNEMCSWLIEQGAKLDVVDTNGWLPIWRAVQRDNLDTVRLFVENYKISRDTIERSAMLAAEKGALKSLRYFIENCKISPMLVRERIKPDSGFLLGKAAMGGHLNVVKYLVEEKGVPVDYTPVAGKDRLYYSALHMASQEDKQSVVVYLRSKGAKEE